MTLKSKLCGLTSTILASLLAACGGGGDGGSTPTPPPQPTVPPPSGYYSGTTSTNYDLTMLVLEDASVWGFYTRPQNNVNYVYGIIQANGTANNGSYTATDGRDYYYTGTTTAGVVSGSYTAAGAFTGSVTYQGGALTFTTTKTSASNYNYDTPAQLSGVIGTWTGSSLDGTATVVTVSSGGAFSGSSGNCSFAGTIAPRPSGKNVFNVSLVFANSSACATPAGTASGIGVTYTIVGGVRSQLLIGVQNPSRTRGTTFIASR